MVLLKAPYKYTSMSNDPDDPMCVCGDPSSMHIDGCEQCFDGGCGCKEFEEAEDDDDE